MSGFLGRIQYKYLVATVYVFALFMDIMDTTIVNVALPHLAVEFHASTSELTWVVTGYILSLAVWIPASGWIGDRFGTKRTFVFALVMFVLGSALCGRAWSVESLTIFRILQGVGGGMLTPVGTAMLYRVFTVHERARASAILSIPTMIAPMIGPLIGGFLVDRVSWRWIFYINLPVGLLGVLMAVFALKEHREENAGRFDPAGFVLSGAGLAAILFSLSRGVDDGWTSPHVLITGLGGVACFAALIFVERRTAFPMLDLHLFENKTYRTASAMAFVSFAALFGVIFLLPFYLQEMRGLSAFESGLTTFAQPIGTIAMVQFTSRAYARIGPRKNIIIASCGMMLTCILFLLVDLSTSLWWIRGIMLVRGMTMAFQMVSVQTTAFSGVPRSRMGRATSLFSVQRQTAVALGVAIMGTVLIAGTNAHTPAGSDAGSSAALSASLLGFHDAAAVALVMAGIGLLFSLQVRDKEVLGFGGPSMSSPEPRSEPAASGSDAVAPAVKPVGA
jgi:EmrB/QacA subfamily drug resistance transporter